MKHILNFRSVILFCLFCFLCFPSYFHSLFLPCSCFVFIPFAKKESGLYWTSKEFVFWLYIFSLLINKKVSFCFKLFHLTTSCVFKAFRAWKKKKDELLNQQIAEKRKKEEKKRLDALMNERMRKSDAESAYLAWYSYNLLYSLI